MRQGKQEERRPFTPHLLILISAILLVGFGLRVWHIDTFSFWSDEGLTPLRSGYPLAQILRNDIVIQGKVTKDTHPAFFYLIISGTRRLFGESDFAFRYPSVLANVLLIALLVQFGRRLASWRLGVVAAFFLATNPLHIWYSNEARMYAIYALLMGGATYMLWQAMCLNARQMTPISTLLRERKVTPFYKYLLGYGLLAGLALYTHYTAVFLIAAQGLFWLWLFRRRGQGWIMWVCLGIAIVAAIPLVPYTIPRLFRGTEADFYFVPPIIMLQDVFRFFSLGVTFTFEGVVLGFFTAVYFLLAALGVWAAKKTSTRLLLLTYLFAVVFGLMAGQFIKPMYQGARHIMVGSPAFVLLMSWGLVWLWEKGSIKQLIINIQQLSINDEQLTVNGQQSTVNNQRLTVNSQQSTSKNSQFTIHNSQRPSIVFAILFWVTTAVALYGPIHALTNLYTANQFAKDDLRSVAQFVDQIAGANDAVVYNDAVLLPLHRHYQTRDELLVTASPTYPKYAANVSPQELTQLSQQVDHIWFVTHPPERDKTGIAKGWLDENLGVIETFPFHARNTELNVVGYRTGSPYVNQLPDEASQIEQAWNNFGTLAAVEVMPPAADGRSTAVDLYWQQMNQPNATLRFALIGPEQQEWAVINQPLLPDNVQLDWGYEGLVRTSYVLPLPEGMPPGTYTLSVQPLVDEFPIGEATAVHTLNLETAVVTTASDGIQFENDVTLYNVQLADLSVRPGHNLPLSLFWQIPTTTASGAELVYELRVVDDAGQTLRQDENRVGPDWFSAWDGETAVRENNSIYIYPEAAPGEYEIELRVRQGERWLERQSWWPFGNGRAITIGKFTVEPWPLNTEMPSFEQPIGADFGGFVTLVGMDFEERPSTLDFTLHWQTHTPPDNNYLIFVHLVNDAGEIVSQIDQIPVSGLRPTGGWRAGEVLVDSYQLPLPPDLPMGVYDGRIGLYLPDSFTRMPITLNGQPQPNDQLELFSVEIP